MSRVRFSCEVYLGDLIPKQEDLKPHDHPLEAWAAQTIGEMIFQHASSSALALKLDYIVKKDITEVDRQAMLDYLQRKADLASEACRSMRVEILG